MPITTAKVPIVKFEHRRSGLEGDISLYNTLVSFTVCKDPGMVTVVILKVYRSLTIPLCLKLMNVSSIRENILLIILTFPSDWRLVFAWLTYRYFKFNICLDFIISFYLICKFNFSKFKCFQICNLFFRLSITQEC